MGESVVAGRGIHRHGAEVARVRYYRTGAAADARYLFVHLTAKGLVTDVDLARR